MRITGIRCFCAIVCCLTLSVFSSCKKSSDDDDPAATTPTSTATATSTATTDDDASTADMSDESFDSTAREIIPVGALSLALTRATAEPEGTPCNDSYTTDDGFNQPENGSFECAVAKLFADPDVYGNVGQEGVLESLQIVDKVFKRSATATCADPLTGDDQDIAGPVLEGTRKYSCGHLITAEEMADNLKHSELSDMENATDEQLAQMAAGINAFIYWGETGATGAKVKNLVAIDEMTPTSKGDDSHEKGVWRFQKSQAANEFIMETSNVHDQSGNGDTTLYQSMYKFSGNWETHEFTVILRRGSVVETESTIGDLLIKGMGVAKGAGEYYLLKLKGSGYTWNGTVYGDDELSVCMSADTQTIAADSNCAKYEDDLNAMDYYEKTDLPDEFTDVPDPSSL